MFVYVFHICIMFNVFCFSNVLCVFCVCDLLNVESILDMDVFKLPDFYIDEFHIVGFGNFFVNKLESFMLSRDVATLTLGLRPKQAQGLVKVRAKSEARESHSMFLGVWESVRE
jgi:hypothetical protein